MAAEAKRQQTPEQEARADRIAADIAKAEAMAELALKRVEARNKSPDGVQVEDWGAECDLKVLAKQVMPDSYEPNSTRLNQKAEFWPVWVRSEDSKKASDEGKIPVVVAGDYFDKQEMRLCREHRVVQQARMSDPGRRSKERWEAAAKKMGNHKVTGDDELEKALAR